MTTPVVLTVNGERVEVTDIDRWTLADVLRDRLELTGTNVGCEHGICGACTVLVDGSPARSCLVLAMQANGSAIETVEGLGTPDDPHPLQVAFSEERALQCGFCTPGFLMLAEGLLRDRPAEADDIADALAANLCRCTGYEGIRRAVCKVVADQAADGEVAS